jgi:uncharacterized protein YecA (UPF0149 family)
MNYQADPVAQKIALGLGAPPRPAAAKPAVLPGGEAPIVVTKKRQQIGVILSITSSPETLGLLPSLVPTLAAANYGVAIVTLPADPASAREQVIQFLDEGVAGLLCCPTLYVAVSEIAGSAEPGAPNKPGSGTGIPDTVSSPRPPIIVLWQGAAKAMVKTLNGGPAEVEGEVHPSQTPETAVPGPESSTGAQQVRGSDELRPPEDQALDPDSQASEPDNTPVPEVVTQEEPVLDVTPETTATSQESSTGTQQVQGSDEPRPPEDLALEPVAPASEPDMPVPSAEPVIDTAPETALPVTESVNEVGTLDSQLSTLNSSPPSGDAPCPCGSGKKFKKCHGKWGAGQAPAAHPELDLIFTAQSSPNTINQAPPIAINPITNNPGAVAPDDPCPCGSGKKFKKCHGKWGSGQTAGTITPSEVAPITNNPITNNPGAVAPDDPCPCGSGKKYKKCHGKWGGKGG